MTLERKGVRGADDRVLLRTAGPGGGAKGFSRGSPPHIEVKKRSSLQLHKQKQEFVRWREYQPGNPGERSNEIVPRGKKDKGGNWERDRGIPVKHRIRRGTGGGGKQVYTTPNEDREGDEVHLAGWCYVSSIT